MLGYGRCALVHRLLAVRKTRRCFRQGDAYEYNRPAREEHGLGVASGIKRHRLSDGDEMPESGKWPSLAAKPLRSGFPPGLEQQVAVRQLGFTSRSLPQEHHVRSAHNDFRRPIRCAGLTRPSSPKYVVANTDDAGSLNER